jgi:integrase
MKAKRAKRSTGKRANDWPREVSVGRTTVTVYRRRNGEGIGYRVADYSTGTRRFLSFAKEGEALDEARRIATRLAERDVLGASIRKEEAGSYASAVQSLAPFGLSLPAVADTVAQALKHVGTLANLLLAAEAWERDHRQVTRKPVAAFVAEFLEAKQNRGASARYHADLSSRLTRFADRVRKDVCDVAPADVQAFLDSQKAAPQTVKNWRTVLHTFFEAAVSRGFASANPVVKTEAVKVRATGATEIFTPEEFRKLLEAAAPEFVPVLVLGGFAGLRSAEVERIRWEDLDFDAKHVVLDAGKTKTASRRIAPLCDAAMAWLAPYRGSKGLVWANTGRDSLYRVQRECAAAAGVEWKQNALRHSAASYRFADIADAGRVAAELGNSPAVIHQHYKSLVTAAEAKKWFSILPASGENVLAAEFGG